MFFFTSCENKPELLNYFFVFLEIWLRTLFWKKTKNEIIGDILFYSSQLLHEHTRCGLIDHRTMGVGLGLGPWTSFVQIGRWAMALRRGMYSLNATVKGCFIGLVWLLLFYFYEIFETNPLIHYNWTNPVWFKISKPNRIKPVAN